MPPKSRCVEGLILPACLHLDSTNASHFPVFPCSTIDGDVSTTGTDSSLSIKKGDQTPTSPEKKVRKTDCYPIRFAGIYYKICKVRSAQWRGLFKPLTKGNCSSELIKLTKIPEDIFDGHSSNKMDLLYHHYLIEDWLPIFCYPHHMIFDIIRTMCWLSIVFHDFTSSLVSLNFFFLNSEVWGWPKGFA